MINTRKLLIFTVTLIFAFHISAKTAKPSKVPLWLDDLNIVYPNTEFIAQLGSGLSQSEAENNAQGKLAGYFESNIETKTNSSLLMTEADGVVSKERSLDTKTTVTSTVSLFAIHFSEPYNDKKDKKWYSVAYMNREEVWNQIQPKIEMAKNTFEGLFDGILKKTDSYSKLKRCKECGVAAEKLLEDLEFARLISSEKEAVYKSLREPISQLKVIYNEEKLKCTVYIEATGDYNKIISTAVANALSSNVFSVVKSESEANYVVKVIIEDNASGEEPISIKPAVNLKILTKQNKTVYSQEVISEEKAIAYTLENARKKIFPKLANEIENKIKEEL